MIVLDSTACIDFLHGVPEMEDLMEKHDALWGVTVISEYEVQIGLERTRRKKSRERYEELRKKWYEFLNAVQVIELDARGARRAAQIYERLESEGRRIDDNDCLIAGIMLERGLTRIATRNARHFKRVVQLEVLSY